GPIEAILGPPADARGRLLGRLRGARLRGRPRVPAGPLLPDRHRPGQLARPPGFPAAPPGACVVPPGLFVGTPPPHPCRLTPERSPPCCPSIPWTRPSSSRCSGTSSRPPAGPPS